MAQAQQERITASQLRGLRFAQAALRIQSGQHATWCDLIAGPKFADDTALPFKWECSCGVASYQAMLATLLPQEGR